MEVTGLSPWKLDERMKLCSEVRQHDSSCKLIILVDENDGQRIASEVKQAMKDGHIDLFVYSSTGTEYLVALMETL